MLRLPVFALHEPETLGQVLELLRIHQPSVGLFAGGTDLLPNIKLGQTYRAHWISLRRVEELHEITPFDGGLRLGASSGLATLATDPDLTAGWPALAQALDKIASPQIRNMATLGGNLCLDTRCRYINQSQMWRQALGGCLKSHGDQCHVVPGGKGCVAALSADSVAPLIAYGAEVDILGPSGLRRILVQDLYDSDGLHHVRCQPDEVLTAVVLPAPPATRHVRYRKWSVRKSIDFPLVSVAVRLDVDAQGLLSDGLIAVAALGPKPRVLPLGQLRGRVLDEQLAHDLGQMAFDRCRPLPNIPYDPAYRRERLAVEVRRAVRDMAGLPIKPLAARLALLGDQL